MKSILAATLLTLAAACSHHDAAPAAPSAPAASAEDPETDPNTPNVDPTMPSWSPRSCNAYHVAVVHVLDCEQIEPTKRAQIKAQYDLDHAKWQAMQSQPPEAIDQVREACKSQWRTLRATYTTAQCAPQAASTPTASTP